MSEPQPLARLQPERATAIFDDPGWFKQAWVSGLYALIPILGPVVIVGWGKDRFTQGLTEPNTLAPVSFERDLAAGEATAPGILAWPAALLALNALRGLLMFFTVTALQVGESSLDPQLISTLTDLIAGASELTSSVLTVLWVPWVLLLPELMRRVYMGDPFPWLNPGPSFVAIKENSEAYLKVLVATTLTLAAMWMASGFFAWLWLLVAPLGWVVLSHFVAQWQGMVRQRGAPGSV